MKWDAEFALQWQTFINTVETRVTRDLSTGELNKEAVNAIIRTEAAKWHNSTHYSGAWLRKLTWEHPQLGEEFQTTLQDLRVDKLPSFKPLAPILYSLGLIALMALTFAVLRWQQMSLIQQILGAIVIGLITAPLFAIWRTNRRRKATATVIEQIRRELQPTGWKLRDIAVRAVEADEEAANR